VQDLYPQLLGRLHFCNPPKSLLLMWKHVIGPLLPKRVKAKIGLLDIAASAADRARLHGLLRRDHLPAFLGGTSRVPWPPDIDAFTPIGITPFVRYD
jgi:hypothetical protein